MNQTRHLLVKDFRRLRWIAAAWVALVCARTFIRTVGADIALGGVGAQLGISEVSLLLSLVSILLLTLFVSRIVHEEPLVGLDAFWITRPIAPGALVSAKLALVVLFLVVVPAAGDVVVAAAFGTGAAGIAAAVSVAAFQQTILVTLLMALAAVTPSLTRFLLAIVGVVAGFATLTVAVTVMALLATREFDDGGSSLVPDPTPAVVGGLLVALTALAVIIYQYRTRRLRGALAIAAVGAFVVFIVPARWTWSFAARPFAETAAPPQEAAALAVSLAGGAPRVSDAFTLRRRMSPLKQVSARTRIAGLPPQLTVRIIAARSRLELPDGTAIETGGNDRNPQAFGFVGGSISGRESAVAAALGSARLLTKSREIDATSSEQWPVLLTVDEGEFVRHRSEPGRLTADLALAFERATVRSTLRLADGSAQDIGALHIRIVRVIRHATGCTVLFRRSYVESLFSRPRRGDFMYVLRNQARGEAAGSDVRELSQDGINIGAFFLSSPRIGGRGFVLEQYEITFPNRSPTDDSSVDLDERWMDGAELVTLEMVPAGVIRRTVTFDAFQMVR